MSEKLRVAVIGAGRMGADHIARLHERISGAEVAAVVGLAFDFFGELLEVFEASANFGVEFLGHVYTPALDPLRTGEATVGVLSLAAAAAGAAPGGLGSFKHGSDNAVLACQVQRGGHARRARADYHHVGIGVAADRTVVRWRIACRSDPVGRCITGALAGRGVHQRVVGRFVGPHHVAANGCRGHSLSPGVA